MKGRGDFRNEVTMSELVHEDIKSGHDLRLATGDSRTFEPEILAFCCEH
jgi:hypothetical protein